MATRHVALLLACVGLSMPVPPVATGAGVSADDAAVRSGEIFPSLSPEQVARDLDLLERTLTTLHPGYERYTPRESLDRSMTRVRSELSQGASVDQLYLQVSGFLALIRCDHTKAEYPDSITEHRRQNPTHLPWIHIIRGGRVFVEACVPESGLARGDEILEIDGVPMVELLGRLRALVPIDGYTEHARDDELEGTSEYMGSALEQFLPLILGWSDGRDVLVRRGDEFVRLRVACVNWADWQAFSPVGPARNFKDAVTLSEPVSGKALLRVDTFVNYRDPVDPDQVLGSIFAGLNERGVEHLIVDLRRNGGGSDDAQRALARRLIRDTVSAGPGSLVRTARVPDDLRPHLSTWDTSVFDPPAWMLEAEGDMFRMKGGPGALRPAADAFAGRVTLLTSRSNSSGVTLLLSALRTQPHIRTIGEATGGSATGCTAGVIVFLKLPESGITVRVPLIRSRVANPRAVEGLGIEPDVLVEVTAEDILAGRDPALEAAVGMGR